MLGVQGLRDFRKDRPMPVLECPAEQILLAVEVVVNGPLGHAGRLRNLLQARGPVPACRKYPKRRLEQGHGCDTDVCAQRSCGSLIHRDTY